MLSNTFQRAEDLGATGCHWTQFSLLFFIHFRPNFPHFPYFSISPYVYLSYVFLLYVLSCSRTDDKDTIQLVLPVTKTTIYLLDYQTPKTVSLLFNHPILRWNFLGHPCLLPQFKVSDFPDMEHE